MHPLLVYLLIVNALAFFLMLRDKHNAKKKQWRIPEKTLLAVAVIGGSLGAIAGMQLFQHKTKHLKFSVGLPAIFSLQVIAAVILWVLR